MSELNNTPVAALLELAACQLEVAVQTTEAQVDSLASSIGALLTLGASLRQVNGAAPPAPAAVVHEIVERAQNALVAMQFHDQLVQRVAHVRDALTGLNDALASAPAADVDWASVLAGIRERYSMEDERMQFDRIIGVDACPAVASHDATHDSLRGSVDLF